MSDYETICGACRSPWPCDCEHAAPVTLMDTAQRLADRMANRDDPLALQPYDPDPPITMTRYGEDHCGHSWLDGRFDLDVDKRVVSCRKCGTALDPYDVLERLVNMLEHNQHALKARQDLERKEAEREGARLARARVRRHRYAGYAFRRGPEHCATCGGQREDAIHT